MNSEGRALFVVVQCAFGLCTNEKSIPLRRFAVLHFIQFCRADGAMPAEPILLRNQPTQPSTLASRVRSLLYDVAWCDALHCFTQYLLGLLGAVAVPVRPILNASSEIICLLNPFFVSLGIDIIRVFQDCYSTSSTSYKTRHHFPPNQRLQHLRTGDWVGNLLFRQASSILHIHVPAIKLVSMIAGLIRHLASAKHRGSHTEEYDANHHANEGPELQCRPSKI